MKKHEYLLIPSISVKKASCIIYSTPPSLALTRSAQLYAHGRPIHLDTLDAHDLLHHHALQGQCDHLGAAEPVI